MMDHDAQLKLQAFLDGELAEGEARMVAEGLARDPEGAALLAELRHTRQALAGFEAGVKLPESREFYWSKIEREIERVSKEAREPVPVPWIVRLRRVLVPAVTVALLALVGLLSSRHGASTPGVETALADSGAFTYHDYSAGATLVWLSYPADSEVADDEDLSTLE